MPSFLLSRKTPQKAASVPCSRSTRRSSPEGPAVMARRSVSVGGVRSKVVISQGILTHSTRGENSFHPPVGPGGRGHGFSGLGRLRGSTLRLGRHGGRDASGG